MGQSKHANTILYITWMMRMIVSQCLEICVYKTTFRVRDKSQKLVTGHQEVIIYQKGVTSFPSPLVEGRRSTKTPFLIRGTRSQGGRVG